MITFTLCLLALIAGYFLYGRFMERVFGPDNRKTPALTRADGVDYIPLVCFHCVMEERAFLKSSDVIWG